MEDNNLNNQQQTKSKKLMLLYVFFIACFVILVSLYFNFQLSYKKLKLNNQQPNSKQEEVISIPKEQSIKTNSLKQTSAPEDTEIKQACDNNFAQFVDDFYLMKQTALNGNDYTSLAITLSQSFKVPENIISNIKALINLAPENKSILALKHEFQSIIKDLYLEPNDSKIFNLKKYIIVRKTGEKALKEDGLDNKIFQIEQALEQNNLYRVNEILNVMEIEPLNRFKADVRSILTIQQNLYEIESFIKDKLLSN